MQGVLIYVHMDIIVLLVLSYHMNVLLGRTGILRDWSLKSVIQNVLRGGVRLTNAKKATTVPVAVYLLNRQSVVAHMYTVPQAQILPQMLQRGGTQSGPSLMKTSSLEVPKSSALVGSIVSKGVKFSVLQERTV